ncbi:UNVERIFIED_CONTAM: hypothetical protein ACS92_07245 [Bacillus cereus]
MCKGFVELDACKTREKTCNHKRGNDTCQDGVVGARYSGSAQNGNSKHGQRQLHAGTSKNTENHGHAWLHKNVASQSSPARLGSVAGFRQRPH